VQNVAVKAAITPVLIGGASLAGRRWGHQVGGWLVGLPLTSGPVAFFLTQDQGSHFAAVAAVGMLAASISQVAFAVCYLRAAQTGMLAATGAGCAGFAASTLALAWLHLPLGAALAGVMIALAAGLWLARRWQHPAPPSQPAANPATVPRWDIPVRMATATTVVIVITALAPVLGPLLAGLLSPFPVFGAVLATFTHHGHGPAAASSVLRGLMLGLFAPTTFFLTLATVLPVLGLPAFAPATAAALITQAITLRAIPATPASQQPATPP
jgi:hypothetical protein